MAQFINPFPGLLEDDKLSENALIQALRQALAAEEEAIHLYETLAEHTDNKLADEILRDIAREEQVHIGELQELIDKFDKNEKDAIEEGRKEVRDEEDSSETVKEDKTSFKIDKNILKEKLSVFKKIE